MEPVTHGGHGSGEGEGGSGSEIDEDGSRVEDDEESRKGLGMLQDSRPT